MNQDKIKELEKKINEEYNNTVGIVVLKDHQLQYEHYFHEYDQNNYVHVYSVTKSILSILIGIAIDKGYIQNVHQKVLDFFPEYQVKKKELTIQNITIEHLLTMSAPYKYKDSPISYIKYFKSKDYLKSTLDLLGGKDAIGKFRYTPIIGPDILSGILVKATGQSVFDFATENLLKPLDITVEKNIVLNSAKEQMAFNESTTISGWVTDSQGLNTGAWGLTLSPIDMAKIGQLYLNDGQWEGQQIVSSKWLNESIQEHSEWEENHLKYGYLWWIINEDERACAAMGDGGNVIYFNKQKNLVVSIASLFIPEAKDRITLIQEYIEPLFE